MSKEMLTKLNEDLKLAGYKTVKKNEIFFIADRGEAFVRDYLWASRDKSIINASK